ncbi:unnamed protein product [Orchesella dallaii]|uniref:Mediator of RNA polymerase II transcription subunit 31 n=1 Tax=Orchesella dallaii TaxID=48710 RepID=A0ABP1PP24_9HEXA
MCNDFAAASSSWNLSGIGEFCAEIGEGPSSAIEAFNYSQSRASVTCSYARLEVQILNSGLAGNTQTKMATPRAETEDQLKLRFQVELEFVQCLANPNYLNFLAQRDYFKDPALINYLKYLQYWKEPEYARYLKYPMCLYFLDLLQYPEFRKELANAKCAKFIEDQQLLHWQHYIRKRSKLIPPNSNQGSNSITQNTAITDSGNNSTSNTVSTTSNNAIMQVMSQQNSNMNMK